MLVEPSPNQNEIMMLISWNFWPLSGPSLKGSMSTSTAVRLTYSLTTIP